MQSSTQVQCRDCGYEFDRTHRRTCPRCLVELSKSPPLRPGERELAAKSSAKPVLVLDEILAEGKSAPAADPKGKSATRRRVPGAGGSANAVAARAALMGMALGALATFGLPRGDGAVQAHAATPPSVEGLVEAKAAGEAARPVPLEQLEPSAPLELALFERKPTAYGFDTVLLKLANPGPATVQEIQVFATGHEAGGAGYESPRAQAAGLFAPGATALLRIDVPSGATLENLVVRHWSERLGSVPLHTGPPAP